MSGTHRMAANPAPPPIALCEHCRLGGTETLSIIVHAVNRHEVLSPLDMLAVQSIDKGLHFHLKGGRVIYEILTLKGILLRFPGYFFRAGRDWLVANDQVAGYSYDSPGHHSLQIKRSDLVVPVARREWPAVAARLGIGLRGPRPRSHTLGRRLQMLANLTHNHRAPA